MKIIKYIISIITFKKFYFFASSHTYLSFNKLKKIKKNIKLKNSELIFEYENLFSKILGKGRCVSFASARMGLYCLMDLLELKKDDQVIVLGATCAVVINSILKIGAKPVFSDIDDNTFGSNLENIKKVYNKKTKVIIAQHSFGIPCDIENIKDFCEKNNIFLIEDCALSLSSKKNGKIIGNFGNAAIFSTDHTKPINTLIGGMIYTNDKKLYQSLKDYQKNCQELSIEKRKFIWTQFLLEYFLLKPNTFFLFKAILKIIKIINKDYDPFLNDDRGTVSHSKYPYPALLPAICAQIGIYELNNWNDTMIQRKKYLNDILFFFNDKNLSFLLPNCYFDEKLEIIPLRFAFIDKFSQNIEKKLDNFLDISSIWFKTPIVDNNESLENYGYFHDDCKLSEEIGKKMINFPMNIDKANQRYFINKINKYITE